MTDEKLIALLRDCSSDEAMWSRQAADRIEALVESAYAEGFSEGADGGWIEGDYSKPWAKSATLRAIGGEA